MAKQAKLVKHVMTFQEPPEQDSTIVDMGIGYGSGEDLAWALLLCALLLVVVAVLGEQERRGDAQRSERRMAEAKRAAARWQAKHGA